METVIVNPSRVFGPGPRNPGNSVTKIIELYYKGWWHVIPGNGIYTGNYVYIDDVVNGHILAGLKGKAGERYLLGGDNLSFNRFFEVLQEVTGKRRWLVHLPMRLMATVAELMEWQARITNIPPLITEPWIRKYMNNWSISSKKAERDLGYHSLPFKEGVEMTLRWMKYL